MTKKIAPLQPPLAIGPELRAFNPDILAEVRLAFEPATPVASQQGWLAKPEPDFAPMTVRCGWQPGELFVFAELTDADIFTRATAHHQRLWELGDTFEIFLRLAGQESYLELQVAPNNRRLQLRYPDPAAVERARALGSAKEFVIREKIFRSHTWLRSREAKWFVLAQIAARLVCGKTRLWTGLEWRFSFSRYDYTHGRMAPVISSTSPHVQADFHRQPEWGILRLASATHRTAISIQTNESIARRRKAWNRRLQRKRPRRQKSTTLPNQSEAF